MVRFLIRTALLATALTSIWAGSALSLWQTFGPSDGLAPGFVVSILEDRSGNLWFGTDRNGGDLNDTGSISRFDGASWQTSATTDGGSVTAMYEDHSGNIWIGSERGGLSRFDGVSWRTYSIVDGLAPGGVSKILEDHLGNIWVGTSDFLGGGGLSRFDGVAWRTYTAANGLAADNVVAMIEDRSGNLWVGATYKGRDVPDGGLSRFDGTSWRTYSTADGLAANSVSSMLEDRSGNLWIGAYSGGVSRFDGVSWRTYTPDGPAGWVRAILEDRAGNLWFAASDLTGGGVSRFDGGTWRTYTMADGLVDQDVLSMLEDRRGNLWFVTHQGVGQFDGRGWRTYRASDGLTDNHVDSIQEDRWGNLWFGSRSAVSRFDGTSWRTFTTSDGMPANVTTAVFQDRSGNLWFNSHPGVTRFDGVNWQTYTTADGLVGDDVTSIIEDAAGNLWFGTACCGVSRFDGLAWQTYTTADGLASNNVTAILEDRSGNLWFGTWGGFGVSRFDGSNWRTYTTEDGLPPGQVTGMAVDHSGNVWVGGYDTSGYGSGGVSRFDGVSWTAYAKADGLAGDIVFALYVDSSGDLWVGTYGNGLSRFDGSSWRTYTTADGLANNSVQAISEDRTGRLWFGTLSGGATSFDGTSWRTYTTSDGLSSNSVGRIIEDRVGDLWFGITRYTPDRVSPRTVFLSKPQSVGASRNLSAAFVAAFSESKIEFSYRLDHGAWSSWSPIGNWVGTNLSDGLHTLEARSRDYATNVDSFPPMATFEVDATPPTPVLTSPAFGAVVRGAVEVRGSADDPRLQEYRVDARPAGAASWEPPIATQLTRSSVSVRDGPLATWDTSSLADGLYDLRLSAGDSLGLAGSAQVTVIVDNHSPFADVTTPAVVSAAMGGNIFTTNAEAHLYFPPHAFAKDALITVTPAVDPSVPAWTLPSGTVQVLAGYDIAWGSAPLLKPARLEFSYATGASAAVGAPGQGGVAATDGQRVSLATEQLAVYRNSNASWERLGGTKDTSAGRISLAITAPGIYALFVETGVISGNGSLGGLAFTPRVFSPTGTFADRELGISFTLGRAAPVTVRVYSRSGRLIREVLAGQRLNAGANLVRWDGRDRNGGYAADGMYLVTVEALGKTERKTLAVVK